MKLKKLLLLSLLLSGAASTVLAQSWSELGTGTNMLNAGSTIVAVTTDASGNIYTTGNFTNAAGKQYVAKWNGTSWTELGTGTNALNANNAGTCITKDPSGNIYVAGDFTNNSSHRFVAKWNGTSWAELGSGANALNADALINAVIAEPSGNIYASGMFHNSLGNYYVAKWDGTSWAELGTGTNALNASNWIISIAADAAENIYAGGSFTNSSGKYFIAKWSNSAAVDSVDVRTVGNVPAVITTLGAAGELPLTAIVFPANANQAVNWSIVPGTGTANISATGAVTGLTIGTVWAKAVSTSNTSKMDSLLIEIRGTGIKDKMADMGIKLYPNPAGKELFLAVEQAHNELEMKITDLGGRAVMTKTYTANSLNRPEAINIKELAPGIYFLSLKGNGMDITMKFIKK